MGFWNWLAKSFRCIEIGFVWRFFLLIGTIIALSVSISLMVYVSLWFVFGIPLSILGILYAVYRMDD